MRTLPPSFAELPPRLWAHMTDFRSPQLVFLGHVAVGKSCLVGRFVRDEFLEFQESTIGGMYPLVLPQRMC